MSSETNEIDYLTSKTYVGEFLFPDDKKYFGKLIYEKDKRFEFILYVDSFLEEKPSFGDKEIQFESIYAKLTDENEQAYFISFKNCRIYLSKFSTAGNQYQSNFDYAIFSKQRCFDFEKDKMDNLHLFLNVWDEFCFPQGFKSNAEFKAKTFDFKLKNKMFVSFNQDIRYHFLNQNNIFNSLFCNNGLNEDEKGNIEEQLKTILLPHKDKIGIKLTDKHKWFIALKNIPVKLDIDNICWFFESLITCLTKDFGTVINKIKIYSKIDEDKYLNEFYFLNYRHFPKKQFNYSFQRAPFKFNTFSKSDWEIMLNNLFKHKNKFQNLFYILLENNEHNSVSEFGLERYIDCIAAIGRYKNYGSEKYEKVLKDFVNDLEAETKNKLLNIFRTGLHNIKVTKRQNKQSKRNWGLIGIKISNLRALTTHFEEGNGSVNMMKLIDIYHIIELIVIDYIFEILEISKDKRLEYKKYYLSHNLK